MIERSPKFRGMLPISNAITWLTSPEDTGILNYYLRAGAMFYSRDGDHIISSHMINHEVRTDRDTLIDLLYAMDGASEDRIEILCTEYTGYSGTTRIMG